MPIVKPPVEIVEVATVLVALKLPKVGVEVATITPVAFVESMELMATPDKVTAPVMGPENPVAVKIPVEGTKDNFVVEIFAAVLPAAVVQSG